MEGLGAGGTQTVGVSGGQEPVSRLGGHELRARDQKPLSKLSSRPASRDKHSRARLSCMHNLPATRTTH